MCCTLIRIWLPPEARRRRTRREMFEGFRRCSEISVRTKQASCRYSRKTVFSRLLPQIPAENRSPYPVPVLKYSLSHGCRCPPNGVEGYQNGSHKQYVRTNNGKNTQVCMRASMYACVSPANQCCAKVAACLKIY